MENKDHLRKAFSDADAIMALEGFTKTEEIARVQEAVIRGELTFDEAIKKIRERLA